MEVRLSREEDLKTVHPFLMKEKKQVRKSFSLSYTRAHILSLSFCLSHAHTLSFSSDPFFDERPDNPIQQEGL